MSGTEKITKFASEMVSVNVKRLKFCSYVELYNSREASLAVRHNFLIRSLFNFWFIPTTVNSLSPILLFPEVN